MPRWLLSSSNWCPLSCSCFPVCVCVCLCVCVCVCVAGGVGRGARLAHGQTDRQTDRHAHRQTDTHTADTQQTHRRTHTVRFPTCVLVCSLQVRGMHPLSLSLSLHPHTLSACVYVCPYMCSLLHVFLTSTKCHGRHPHTLRVLTSMLICLLMCALTCVPYYMCSLRVSLHLC